MRGDTPRCVCSVKGRNFEGSANDTALGTMDFFGSGGKSSRSVKKQKKDKSRKESKKHKSKRSGGEHTDGGSSSHSDLMKQAMRLSEKLAAAK